MSFDSGFRAIGRFPEKCWAATRGERQGASRRYPTGDEPTASALSLTEAEAYQVIRLFGLENRSDVKHHHARSPVCLDAQVRIFEHLASGWLLQFP